MVEKEIVKTMFIFIKDKFMINLKKIVLVGLLALSSLCSAGICDCFWGEEAQLTDKQIRKNFLDAMREFNSSVESAHLIFFTPLKELLNCSLYRLVKSLDKLQKMEEALPTLLTVVNENPEAIEMQDISIDEKARKFTEKKIIENEGLERVFDTFNESLKKCHQKHPDKKEKCNQLYRKIAQRLFSKAQFEKMFIEEKEN